MIQEQEHVLVIPRAELEGFLPFRGFRPVGDLDPESWAPRCSFKPRLEMESDAAYKQLIPYIILRCGDRVFRYWRTKTSSESRLHHLYSVGVGGHVNPHDDNLFAAGGALLREAAERELDEEVELAEKPSLRLAGFINDDEVEVGVFHLGVVYEANLAAMNAVPRERALGRGEWKPAAELMDGVEYESWSSFVIRDYLMRASG
ncbi:MAG: phosphoesterase [bacterium]|nr:phosphoesterase [bacterium]